MATFGRQLAICGLVMAAAFGGGGCYWLRAGELQPKRPVALAEPRVHAKLGTLELNATWVGPAPRIVTVSWLDWVIRCVNPCGADATTVELSAHQAGMNGVVLAVSRAIVFVNDDRTHLRPLRNLRQLYARWPEFERLGLDERHDRESALAWISAHVLDDRLLPAAGRVTGILVLPPLPDAASVTVAIPVRTEASEQEAVCRWVF